MLNKQQTNKHTTQLCSLLLLSCVNILAQKPVLQQSTRATMSLRALYNNFAKSKPSVHQGDIWSGKKSCATKGLKFQPPE